MNDIVKLILGIMQTTIITVGLIAMLFILAIVVLFGMMV